MVPREKDWSNAFFYSKTLQNIGFETPGDQYNLYWQSFGSVFGLAYFGRSLFSAYHLAKLTAYKEGTPEWTHHWLRTTATQEQMKRAPHYINQFRLKGSLGLAPMLYLGWNIMQHLSKK